MTRRHLTLECTDQGLGIERCLGVAARSAVRRYGALGKAIDKVADDEFFAGEVVEGEARPLGEESLGARSGPLHGGNLSW